MEDYIEKVLRTESTDFDAIKQRLQDEDTIRLLHAAIGMVTESAELLDMLKKHIYYGKPLDNVNAVEESGDLSWYQAIGHDVLNVSLDEVQRINIAKLQARYPEKFTQEKAINRDLETERKILEQ